MVSTWRRRDPTKGHEGLILWELRSDLAVSALARVVRRQRARGAPVI